jgi:hypothetical protein
MTLLVIVIYTWIDCYTPVVNIHDIHNSLLNMYPKMKSAFEDHDIVYWADGGTLLGAIRSKSIIPHDDDMDFRVLESEVDKLLTIDFESYGLKLCTSIIGYEIRSGRSPACIDLFIVKQHNGKYVYQLPHCTNAWPNAWYYENEVFPLEQHRIGEEVTVPCPHDPIPYFVRHFGTDWEIPKSTHYHHRLQRHMAYYPLLAPVIITLVSLLSVMYVCKYN